MSFPVVYTPEPTRPGGRAQPGTVALLSFLIGTFDLAVMGDEIHSLGIYNPRDIAGNPWPHWTKIGSQHARGAAGDAGVPTVRPKGHPEGHRVAAWLVLWHAQLGVQEVIWAGRRWHNRLGVIPWEQWPHYEGRSDHFDHVHFAQTAQAATELTLDMILAVWEQHPAPPDPNDQEDEMELFQTADDDDFGDDRNSLFLRQGDRYSHIASPADYSELLRQLPDRGLEKATPIDNAVTWALLKTGK